MAAMKYWSFSNQIIALINKWSYAKYIGLEPLFYLIKVMFIPKSYVFVLRYFCN